MKLRFRNLLAVLLVLSFSSMSVYPQLNRSKQIEKSAKTEPSQFRQLEETDDRKDSFWAKVLSDVSEAESRRVVRRQATLESPAGGSVLVTNLNDSGPGSLRQALIDVPISGTIYFDGSLSGTIELTTGSLLINKALTVTGPGARLISIDGGGLMTGSVFVIRPPGGLMDTIHRERDSRVSSPIRREVFESPQGPMTLSVEIAGLTIRNGKGSLPIISPVSNEPQGGSSYFGGGIYAAIPLGVEVQLRIHECTIADNLASGDGGGVYLSGVAQAIISNTTFDGNVARNGGGLFIDESGQSLIVNSTFSNNIAWLYGGAIHRTAINQVVGAAFTSISYNFAGLSGGGIFNVSAPPPFTKDDFLESPRGEEPETGAFRLVSSIVASNYMLKLPLTGGPSGDNPFYPDLDGIFTADYSLVGIVDGGTGVSNGVAGNIVGNFKSPVDPEILPLANNGGQTDTMALASTSPAIDAGNLAGIVNNTDQRGALRPWYPTIPTPFPGLGDGSDIGAYEYNFTTASGVSVGGKVVDDLGRSITGAQVSFMDSETGVTQTVRTNQFGRYSVEGLTAGRVFVVSVSSKSSKDNPVQILNLAESLGEINFTLSRRR